MYCRHGLVAVEDQSQDGVKSARLKRCAARARAIDLRSPSLTVQRPQLR